MTTENLPGTNSSKKSFLSSKLALVSITAVLTAAIMFFVMKTYYGDNREDENYIYSSNKFTSEPITWEEAKTMMTYWNDHALMNLRTTDDNGRTKQPLLAFKFNSAHIESILHNNAALDFDKGEMPDDIIFYFGRDVDSVGGVLNTKHFMKIHMIALGIKGNQLLKDGRNGKPPTIFDKADPCPPGKNCPDIKP